MEKNLGKIGIGVLIYCILCAAIINSSFFMFALPMTIGSSVKPIVPQLTTFSYFIFNTFYFLIFIGGILGILLTFIGSIALMSDKIWGKRTSLSGIQASIICALSGVVITFICSTYEWGFFRLTSMSFFIAAIIVIGSGILLIKKLISG